MERPPSWWSRQRERAPRLGWAVCALLLLTGISAIVLALVGVGPERIDAVGAVAVTVAYVALLAQRTGGRPLVFGLLALVLAVVTVTTETPMLTAGASVLVTALSAVLAVLATVPAVTFLRAMREVVVAMVVASLGGLAAVAFRPELDVARFAYATVFMAFGLAFVLVYRLGAGLHGVGRRGVVLIVVGTVMVALALAYGELLRRYGTPALVQSVVDLLTWTDTHLGATPQALMTLLGAPALVWGVHQRARRRQGWWACAYGVAATARPAYLLVRGDVTLGDAGLALLYSVVLGLVLGYLVIRADLFLTGAGRRRGRRSVKAEEALALRPEPARTRPLL